MRKITLCILSALIVLFGVCILCACQPATMDKVTGTYELVTFTRSVPNEKENPEDETTYTPTDLLKQAEIKSYIVVRSDGTGYVVYSDKSTPLYIRSVKLTYDYKDGTNKLNKVNYSDGIDKQQHTSAVQYNGTENIPGRGCEDLYVNAGSDGMELKRNDPYWDGLLIHRYYIQDVVYKKISDATDLSAVNQKLSTNLTAPTYELQGLDKDLVGYTLYLNEHLDYIYYGVRVNPYTQKATVYYAKKSDGQDEVKENVDVTYRVVKIDEYNNIRTEITIDGITYTSGQAVPTNLSYSVEEPDGEGNLVTIYSVWLGTTSGTMEEYIASEKEGYQNYLATQAQQNQNSGE